MRSPGGRTRTRTGSGLSGVPLLIGLRRETGGPGRTCTANLPSQSRTLWLIELRGWMKLGRASRTRTG